MVYSGWKFILFLVFSCMTSDFICSILRSNYLWRIATIVLSLEKAVYCRETLLLSVKILSCNLHEIKISAVLLRLLFYEIP